MMVKKAIFGGTFDPIHNGHLHIAYEALYRLKLDKVIFIPSGNPPHKLGNNVTDAVLRYGMVKAAIKNEKYFEISDYEIRKHNLSYTYNTLKYFNNLEKTTQWYFITGADCLMDVSNWKNPKEIFELCSFVVFSRPGYSAEDIQRQKSIIEKKYSNKIIFLDIPLIDISSTNIRANIKVGKSVNYLLPDSVYDIIKQFELYQAKLD